MASTPATPSLRKKAIPEKAVKGTDHVMQMSHQTAGATPSCQVPVKVKIQICVSELY